MNPIKLDIQPGEVVFDDFTGHLVAVLWVVLYNERLVNRVKFFGNTELGIQANLFESRAECLEWVEKQLVLEDKSVRRHTRDCEDE